MHRGGERAPGRVRQAAVARVLGGQHVDALGAECDGVRDRGVVGDPAVGEQLAAPADGRQHPGDGRGGEHRVDRGAVGQAHLILGQQVEGDQVQRNARLLQPLELHVPGGEPAQPAVGDQVAAPAGQAAEERGRAEREDVAAPQPTPDGRQFSPAVATVGGREARNAAFRAPAEVPASRSGTMPRSYRACTIPACMAPRAAPPASTSAVRGAPAGPRLAAGRAVMVTVLIGGQPQPAGSCRAPAPR